LKVEYSEIARKKLKKLDRSEAKLIVEYMREIETLEDPTTRGKPLKANLKGLWRYRVADYRLICEIQDDKLIILVLKIDHRKKIYN
jgi:mRNA interferase RelE/StbE